MAAFRGGDVHGAGMAAVRGVALGARKRGAESSMGAGRGLWPWEAHGMGGEWGCVLMFLPLHIFSSRVLMSLAWL